MVVLYRVIGREVVGRGRYGRYIVEFRRKWPIGVRNIYLVGEFTSLYPGYMKLRRIGGEGVLRLKLWPGTYGYGFQLDKRFGDVKDPDNDEEICIWIPFNPENRTCLSKLVVERPEDPLKDIYHMEDQPEFLHRYMDRVIIRLKASEDIETLYIDLDGEKWKHSIVYDVGGYRVYEYHVEPRKVLSYRFWIKYRDKVLIYGDEGVSEYSSYISIPLKEIRGIDKPSWYMGTIYYQIFVDSFENGDPSNDPPNMISRAAPREYGYWGGDLRGIIKRFNYLKDLGIETIYLTPIFKATSYHRYDTIDYKSIDPYLGDMNDLSELINIVHDNGMHIVLDITMHHTNPCNELFVKALSTGDPRYRDMFVFLDDPNRELIDRILKYIASKLCKSRMIYSDPYFKDRKPFYETFFHVWLMAKFNHDNPGVLEYFKDITKYWVEKGVDGFRIDVAMGIHYAWIRQYYYWVKTRYPEFLILGELSEHPRIYLEYYDSAMDYYWRKIILEYFVYRRIDLDEMVEELNELYTSLPYYKAISLYNLLGSHDTVRIRRLVADKRILRILYILQYILPGSPVIYYGDEIGMDGGRDPDNRRPMIWDRELWDWDIYNYIRELIKIYKEYEAVRHGFYELKNIDGRILYIHRWLNDEHVYTYINTSDKNIEPIPKETRVEEVKILLKSRKASIEDGRIVVEPYGYLILSTK